ncbi:MAG TPA: DNA polymerase I [Candidatus Limnocylindria bacterium]|nr:DNA polymerase I [Candidatus Limnocylindria bacterium]
MTTEGSPASRLYLIDLSGYVHRAFHALPQLTTTRGQPTNAILGVARMLIKLLREERATHLIAVYDAPGPTFRDELYTGYKEHRPVLADELRSQLPYVRRLVEALRIPTLEVPGVEADDVIGTLAAQAEAAGLETVIVTADKDMTQLVSERTTLYDDMRGRRIGVADVQERFGVPPALVPDVLGLMGDSIDAIPGVPGIGAKTAAALVSAFGGIESMLERLDEVPQLKLRGAARVRELLARHAGDARLSRTLATIRRDVPIQLDVAATAWPGPDRERLVPLLRELEFGSLLRELGGDGTEAAVSIERRELASVKDAAALVAEARRAGVVAVVPVFDSPRPTAARLLALALALEGGAVSVVADPERPELLRALAPVFEDLAITKLGADLKALRVALARRGIAVAGGCMDVSLASYCLNPSRAGHDLAALAAELLGQPRAATREPVVAACEDAHAAHALRPLLLEQLRATDMEGLFRDLETPLAAVLAEMELAGIALDVPALRQQSQELEATLARLLREIYELAGGEFNVGSPPQLREVLFERLKLSTKGIRRGKTGLSTDVDVLTKLAAEHALPAKILEWRALSKLKTTYVDALPDLVDPVTGRLHTCFNQTVAATGRLSSSDPNLQNIPVRTAEGRRIRAAFVAEAGRRLLSADYSQIELRLLAHLSGDPVLTAAFRNGEDIHARTAADVFGSLPAAEGRRLAKVINYGIVYGMGPARAARELGVSLPEATAYIEAYFQRYAGVRAFIDATITQARQRGYVSTVLGRRRYLPELGSRDAAVRQFAERAAVNTPIQGSAADLIKRAMLDVHARLREERLEAQMLLQVHDELLVEVAEADATAAAAAVRAAMEGVWPLEVPLQVDVHVGNSWAEVHG